MTKKQKQDQLNLYVKQFENLNRNAKYLKKKMVELRAEIERMPNIVEERFDEANMKQ